MKKRRCRDGIGLYNGGIGWYNSGIMCYTRGIGKKIVVGRIRY